MKKAERCLECGKSLKEDKSLKFTRILILDCLNNAVPQTVICNKCLLKAMSSK